MKKIKYFIFIMFLLSIPAGSIYAMVKTTKTTHSAVPTNLANASEEEQLAAIDAAVHAAKKSGDLAPLKELGEVLDFDLPGKDNILFKYYKSDYYNAIAEDTDYNKIVDFIDKTLFLF